MQTSSWLSIQTCKDGRSPCRTAGQKRRNIMNDPGSCTCGGHEHANETKNAQEKKTKSPDSTVPTSMWGQELSPGLRIHTE
jgi:hypothetical protein